jgi:protein-tyrosine phosphatase
MVCLGNICRSPMAEVILRDELDQAGLAARVVVDSAGTGDWHIGQPMDRRAARELARHGLDGSRHRARQFVPSCFDLYDLIIGMDSANLHDLHAMAPDADAASRVVLLRAFDPALAGHREPGELEVPDPYYERDDYGPVYDLIWPAARGLAGRLAALLDGTRQ